MTDMHSTAIRVANRASSPSTAGTDAHVPQGPLVHIRPDEFDTPSRTATSRPSSGAPKGSSTDQRRSERPRLSLPLSEPVFSASDTSFVALQEWEGYVIAINDDDFEARLLDLTARAKREEEEATIPYSEISEKERSEMRLGSIFRWTIGYESAPSGTRRRISQIVFRDLPVVTQRDADEAWDWALETRRLLGL